MDRGEYGNLLRVTMAEKIKNKAQSGLDLGPPISMNTDWDQITFNLDCNPVLSVHTGHLSVERRDFSGFGSGGRFLRT